MKGLSSAYTICLILLFGILVIHDIRGTAPETRDIQEIRARITPRLTAEFAARDLTFGAPVFMRIFKEEAELEVWAKNGAGFAFFKTYDICNFSGALGPKLKEGDRQSPEGSTPSAWAR